VINPLRSEREAFRFLLYVLAAALVVVAVALALRGL
jgi:predicted nucleic acid-binding Zn ribbon protein